MWVGGRGEWVGWAEGGRRGKRNERGFVSYNLYDWDKISRKRETAGWIVEKHEMHMHVTIPTDLFVPARPGSRVSEDHHEALSFPHLTSRCRCRCRCRCRIVSLVDESYIHHLPALPPFPPPFDLSSIRPFDLSNLRARLILHPHPHPRLSFPLSLVLGCFSVWSSHFLFLSFFRFVLFPFCVWVFRFLFFFWVAFSVPFPPLLSFKVPASIHDNGLFPLPYTFSFFFFFFFFSSLILGDARDAHAQIGEMVPKGGDLIL